LGRGELAVGGQTIGPGAGEQRGIRTKLVAVVVGLVRGLRWWSAVRHSRKKRRTTLRGCFLAADGLRTTTVALEAAAHSS
jgi:hypothetical protein